MQMEMLATPCFHSFEWVVRSQPTDVVLYTVLHLVCVAQCVIRVCACAWPGSVWGCGECVEYVRIWECVCGVCHVCILCGVYGVCVAHGMCVVSVWYVVCGICVLCHECVVCVCCVASVCAVISVCSVRCTLCGVCDVCSACGVL